MDDNPPIIGYGLAGDGAENIYDVSYNTCEEGRVLRAQSCLLEQNGSQLLDFVYRSLQEKEPWISVDP